MNATTIYSEFGLTVHPDILRAVLLFASEDPTRPHIHGPFIDEEGHLSATDGLTGIRIMSIAPGGQVPKDYGLRTWSRAYAESVLESVPKITGKDRAKQLAAQRVRLDWVECIPTRDHTHTDRMLAPPKMAQLWDLGHAAAGASEPMAIATSLLLRLGRAAELVTGRGDDARMYGPVWLNPAAGAQDVKVYGLPWVDHYRDVEPKITWLHGTAPAKTIRKFDGAPTYAAEVLIMPLRIG